MTQHTIHISQQIQLPLDSAIGKSIAVLGISGGGKTNTVSVLAEELLSANMPMSIVDIEGEYWGLREKFEILVIGKSDNCDIQLHPSQAGPFAQFSYENQLPLILDLSEFDDDAQQEFLLNYFTSLWECTKKRKPYFVLIEEAHEFIPQGNKTDIKKILSRFAKRGRKRGLSLILSSQRSAKVEKDILTQCPVYFLHRVVHPIDMRVYKDIIPLPPKQVEDTVSELQPGQAIFLSNHKPQTIHVRQRDTFHAGATPTLGDDYQPTIKKIDTATLKSLQKLAKNIPVQVDANPDKLRIAELEQQIATLQAHIAEHTQTIQSQAETIRVQHQQITLLGKLEVQLNPDKLNGHPVGIGHVPVHSNNLPDNQDGNLPLSTLERGQGGEVKKSIPTNNSQSTPPPVYDSHSNLPPVYGGTEGGRVRSQQARFATLLTDLPKLKKFHRRIARFLIKRPDRSYSAKELAYWLSLKENTIRRNPPTLLIDMGIITRRKTGKGYRYIATASDHLASHYPDLPTNTLIEQLIQQLK